MKIAVLLFTYNRNNHTKQVIDALKRNTVLPSKLYVFQDGLKEKEDEGEWKKVNNLLYAIDWCDKEVIVSEKNKGLAASIVSGVDYAFKEYEAVIVLEDDCVPAVSFINFMNQCLEKYVDNRKIYSVSGYSWPIETEKDSHDIYGCGRISTWGWGTWKNRWEEYEKDYDILRRLKQDREKSRNLALWGSDIEQMLIDRLIGENDSWAVYWGLHVIEKSGICIVPYRSLIQNIGMDGTGVHCGVTEKFQVKVFEGMQGKFELPDEVDILETTKTAFADLYGSYSALDTSDSKEDVLIYGLGNYYLAYEKEINSVYHVCAFIDRKKRGWFAGKKIIRLNEVYQCHYEKIIIMINDIQESINVAKALIAKGVHNDKILLGHALWGTYNNWFDTMCILPDGSLSITANDITFRACCKREIDDFYDIFIHQIYRYYINNNKKDVVFDIGMGIGNSALLFLSNPKVEKVFGFEASSEKFALAKHNLYENFGSQKMEIFQYGYRNENGREELLGGKKITEILGKSISEYSGCNFILKLDCGGMGYELLRELFKEEILCKLLVVMCKCCENEDELVLEYLKEKGFSSFGGRKKGDIGLIYAYNQCL